MKPTILLDVDGVLIRDRNLLNQVSVGAARYVGSKLPHEKNPTQLNRLLYKAYGHTATGLEKEFGIDASDFNKKVYTRKLLNQLDDYLESSDDFKKDAQTVRRLLSMGYDVELFSNAPLVWTEPVRHALDAFRVSTSENYSKPNIDSYLKFDKSVDYVFVDDTISNLIPCLLFKNWTPVHFSERCENTFVKTINSLTLLENNSCMGHNLLAS